MNAIKNITIGDYSKLRKPVLMTMAANLVNIVPFALSIEAVSVIFRYFSGQTESLDTMRLWIIIIVMLAYMVVMIYFERLSCRANFRGAYYVSADGRMRLAEHLRKLPLGFLSKRDPADLSSMLITDFAMAEMGISHYLPQLMGATVMPVIAFLCLVWVDWRMSVAMFVALPLAVLIMFLATKVQNSLNKRQIQAKVEAAAGMEEYLQGLRIIKAYNLEGDKFDRLKSSFLNLKKASIRLEALSGPFIFSAIAIVRSGLTFMILLGSYLIVGGRLDIITFVMFLVIGSRIFDPLTSALTNFAMFRYFSVAGGRILSLLSEKEQTGDVILSEDTVTSGTESVIEFKNVSFSYVDKPTLQDVNIKIKPNTLTALVGRSGSGKSTMMKLIARFYDCQQGDILYNNVSVKTINPESLMHNISMVFQDVYLFKDTIKNNILFGKASDESTNTESLMQEVIRAAKLAQCHDFIMKLPNGYDTMVGEGGQTLSGGEKQRISIARAIMKDAPIILLDEATASLDAENEFQVQQAVNNLIKNKTVIVIAHRLNTVATADNIIVLDKGRIVEQGKHEELMQNEGVYKKLFDMQNA